MELTLLRNETSHTCFKASKLPSFPGILSCPFTPLHSSKPLPFLSLSRFTSAFMMIKIQNLEPTDHFKWKYLIYWFFALIFSCIIFWFNSFPCSEAYHILYTLIQLHILSLTNKIKNQNKQTKKNTKTKQYRNPKAHKKTCN